MYSVTMIERHYGALLDGAGADIARRLDAFEDAERRPTECWATSGPQAPAHAVHGHAEKLPPSRENQKCPRQDSNLRPAA